MKRFGAWIIGAICLVVTALAIGSEALGDALARPGTGTFPTFGPALDLVIAMPVSWLPLVADHSRFATDTRAATRGTFWGYLIANIWLYSLGILLVLGGSNSADPSGIAASILALAGGTVAGILFLIGLLVGETDEAFADIYSGALSLKNIFPRMSHKALTVAVAAVATGLAAWLTMTRYEAFLFLLGSVFVPLFGVLAADHFVVRGGRVDIAALYKPGGAYWFNNGFRFRALVPWIAGALVYQWVLPTGPEWWLTLVERVSREPLSVRWPWLSASIASFAVSFLLTLAPSRAARRSGP